MFKLLRNIFKRTTIDISPELFAQIIGYIDIDVVIRLLLICGKRYRAAITYQLQHMLKQLKIETFNYKNYCSKLSTECNMSYYVYGNVAIPTISHIMTIKEIDPFTYNVSSTHYDMSYPISRIATHNKCVISRLKLKGYRIAYVFLTYSNWEPVTTSGISYLIPTR
jgi:hypothetical protein